MPTAQQALHTTAGSSCVAATMEPSVREPLVRRSSSSYHTFPESIRRGLDKEYLQ